MGARLCAALRENGVAVRALSRRAMPDSPEDGVVWYRGEATRAGDWLEGLEGVRAVIHLAGEPVAGRRWSRDQKRRLRESRVHSTRLIARKLSERYPVADHRVIPRYHGHIRKGIMALEVSHAETKVFRRVQA